MFELKPLSRESIPAALEKAKRYRLLNEPHEAESICQDILLVDPENQEALIMLLLAFTDRFKEELFPAYHRAVEVLKRLSDAHCRIYYRGIINERRAKTHLARGGPDSGSMAFEWYTKAMADYELALSTCSPGNQDAALRWNTCARVLNEHPHLKPPEGPREEGVMDGYE
jgi:hypothetical protein